MREIGILNLTRFGDLIQTTPVLTGLRKRHPGARIHLIVKRRFRPVADNFRERQLEGGLSAQEFRTTWP